MTCIDQPRAPRALLGSHGAGKTELRPADLDRVIEAAGLVLVDTLDAARTAYAWLAQRALHLTDGQWRNTDVLDRMATVLANTTVTVVEPGHLVAATPAGDDGAIWHYIARDALAAAAPDATITMIDAHSWAARWEN